MTLIESRPLRIIASDTGQRPAVNSDAARARRFDYAALVRRSRSQRPPASFDEATNADHADCACARSVTSAGSTQAIACDDGHAPDSSADPEADAATEGAISAHEALLQRLPAATMPAVDALFRTQGHFLELARSLAREVAAFCADPAIGEAGNWEVRIALDERILPDTTLYLSLSRFWLSLRFDTRGIETRQLLFDHSAMLERELAVLLNAWGTPRDIELTVW